MTRYLKGVVALLVVAFISACSGPQGTMEKPKKPDIMQMPDGKIAASGSIGNSLDASSTIVAMYERTKDGRLVQVAGETAIGPTVGGQMAVAAVGGIGAAAVQVAGGVAIAGMKSSCGDNCGGSPIYNVLNGTAVAGAEANVNARQRQSGGTCDTCSLD